MSILGAVKRLLAQQTCDACDGMGCVCMRWRDWQSIDLGCQCRCGHCGRQPAKRAS